MTRRVPGPLPVARTVHQLRQIRPQLEGTVALVPTMGALHEGHRSLFRLAAGRADHVVVSIFVNPLQFGAGEDYDRYPRVLDHDLTACEAEGVGLVFVPSVADLYPPDRSVTVAAGPVGSVLEGASRPGHFDGVLTVVLKLFNLIRPDIAVFGEKDAQQLACIRRMVVDLDVGVEIVGAPTVREPDGLALSSRNRYLSASERQSARAISAGLRAAAEHATAQTVLDTLRAELAAAEAGDPAFRLDYAGLVSPDTFSEVGPNYTGEAVLAVAAYVGNTRLIDNVTVHLGAGTEVTSRRG